MAWVVYLEGRRESKEGEERKEERNKAKYKSTETEMGIALASPFVCFLCVFSIPLLSLCLLLPVFDIARLFFPPSRGQTARSALRAPVLLLLLLLLFLCVCVLRTFCLSV